MRPNKIRSKGLQDSQLKNGEDSKGGKGSKGKQKSSKREENPKAKAGDTSGSDGKPKADWEPKSGNRPQRFNWVEDAECPYGDTCQYTHAPEAQGRGYNCGAPDHLKPACTCPGGRAMDQRILQQKTRANQRRRRSPKFKPPVRRLQLISQPTRRLALAELAAQIHLTRTPSRR